jgi:molybdenum cofactor guanylyltransferase
MINGNVVTGGILAGGRSRRFGSDKCSAEFEGRMLIERVYDTLHLVTEEILVASGGRQVVLPGRSFESVPDDKPDMGPLGGLSSLLRTSSSPWVLTVACDMPCVTAESLLRLVAAIGTGDSAPTDAVVARSTGTGRTHPLLACYPGRLYSMLDQSISDGRLAVKSVLDRLDNVVYVDLDDEETINVNRMSDLTYLASRKTVRQA